MTLRASVLALSMFLAAFSTGAFAVQPDEILADPVLEGRARSISQMLRCPVCQGENIDESNAPISRDLRLYVRERLIAGDNDEQVIDNVVDRFGEFVLFQPRAKGANLILWLAAPIMALLGVIAAAMFLQGRNKQAASLPELSEEERRRLEEIMRKP